jgi:hypothetical protein
MAPRRLVPLAAILVVALVVRCASGFFFPGAGAGAGASRAAQIACPPRMSRDEGLDIDIKVGKINQAVSAGGMDGRMDAWRALLR